MYIKFWGVRGSFPVPGPKTNRYGGNTSCVQVCPNDQSLIVIDAGTGIRRLGQELTSGPCGKGKGVVHLLISHTHWDHIQGIPFFAPLYIEGNLIRFYARQRDVHLRTIFSSQTEDPYFPVSLEDVAAQIQYTELMEGARFHIGEVNVQCARLNHPFIAIGYRLDADEGSIAYVSDTAPFDHIIFSHHFIPGRPDLDAPLPPSDAIKLRKMREDVIDLCRHCDTVIFDTMFHMDEYLARPHWGHSSPEQALALVEEARAASLILFHHAPDRSDDELDRDLAAIQKQAKVPVFAAAEGMVIEVGDGARRIA